MLYWSDYDYEKLSAIPTVIRQSRKRGKEEYSNSYIMLDTETSRKERAEDSECHIVAWAIAIRLID